MLIERLIEERESGLKGGIYHKIQIEFAYNSNHIEGSQLSHEQTRYIFETNTLGFENSGAVRVDDILETTNHFTAFDFVLDTLDEQLSETWIKKLHRLLKEGTSDAKKSWFRVGDYKQIPNEVGGRETTPPEKVAQEIAVLLRQYQHLDKKTFEDILDFHVRFERIHPFQDGNGRVGRLIMFRELLKSHIVPFVITDEMKYFYYRGLAEWDDQKGYLMDTCLTAQDRFKTYLDYFRIEY